MNILFTCAGRRTYLLKYFKEQLGSGDKIIGADMQLTAPALSAADVRVLVPAVYDDFIGTAKAVMTKRHRDALRKLLNYRFKRHPRYNLQDERLMLIEKEVQRRARLLLDE